MFKKSKLMLWLVLLLGLLLRLYGNNWDQGFHLHPDERMLIMVADRINFFKNFNPDFFNYGSLPIYILKGISQLIDFLINDTISNYVGMLALGRSLSVLFDLVTILLVYKIAQLFFKTETVSLLASFLYTVAFFPIQNSHFFVVDVLLNTLITGLIYISLLYIQSSSVKKILLLALIFAGMMSTKFTAIVFLPLLVLMVISKNWRSWKNVFVHLSIFLISFLGFHFIFMPYAFIERQRFITDILQQLKMSSNPYIFPYTLQYVRSTPYWYFLKNIFLWGLGPIITLLSVVGLYWIIKTKGYLLFLRKEKKINFQILYFFVFYLLYFIIIGRSAVKFMRYMLPLYPFFTILAGFGLYHLYKVCKLILYVLIALILIWTCFFVNIYSQTHTRIAATEWILTNIPQGSRIATEHWDDGLPIFGGENYAHILLTLYDQPDDANKWQIMNEKLKVSDYIVVASNRLYVPLQQLSDCKQFTLCYPKAAEYYQNLFSGKLSFIKVAEFSDYPHLQIGQWRWEIKDDTADESFTVYDHPKIYIFKNIKKEI